MSSEYVRGKPMFLIPLLGLQRRAAVYRIRFLSGRFPERE
jgi:hypothetical protein